MYAFGAVMFLMTTSLSKWRNLTALSLDVPVDVFGAVLVFTTILKQVKELVCSLSGYSYKPV